MKVLHVDYVNLSPQPLMRVQMLLRPNTTRKDSGDQTENSRGLPKHKLSRQQRIVDKEV